MNRRGIFKLFAALPFAGGAIVAAAKTAPAPDPVYVNPGPIFGELRDMYEVCNNVSSCGRGYVMSVAELPCHTHSYSYGCAAIARRKIWDGSAWVDFDGPQGAAVMNKILTIRALA